MFLIHPLEVFDTFDYLINDSTCSFLIVDKTSQCLIFPTKMLGMFAKLRIMMRAAIYKQDISATTYLWVISFKTVNDSNCIERRLYLVCL